MLWIYSFAHNRVYASVSFVCLVRHTVKSITYSPLSDWETETSDKDLEQCLFIFLLEIFILERIM